MKQLLFAAVALIASAVFACAQAPRIFTRTITTNGYSTTYVPYGLCEFPVAKLAWTATNATVSLEYAHTVTNAFRLGDYVRLYSPGTNHLNLGLCGPITKIEYTNIVVPFRSTWDGELDDTNATVTVLLPYRKARIRAIKEYGNGLLTNAAPVYLGDRTNSFYLELFPGTEFIDEPPDGPGLELNNWKFKVGATNDGVSVIVYP